MKKSNLYTRTGDQGQTSLSGGQRVSKTHPRIEAYGTLDELNSFVGLLMANIANEADRETLAQVQRHLFAAGAELATPPHMAAPPCALTPDVVSQMEQAIDQADADAGPWRGFVLPAGGQAACLCHVCRTICRRLERRIQAIEEPTSPHVARYVNRLSDYLFALAKKCNREEGIEEKLWSKHS